MRIFVTGASGFIGSAIIQELIDAGYEVLGLARSNNSAESLARAGAKVHRGSLEDLDSLRSGAAMSDGVIHTAFVHNFNNYGPSVEADRRAIEALGAALDGSNRPFLVTSGLALRASGRIATEEDAPSPDFPRRSEQTAMEFVSRGVRASVVRLPFSVHGDGDHGFVPRLIQVAREKGVSAYIGDGLNRWPAVHRLDAARLYKLVLEKGSAGGIYHGVGDEGLPTREIAEAIGRRLNVPVVSKPKDQAMEHFGWIGLFFGMGVVASSTRTQQSLGWRPTHVGLIDDLERGTYFETQNTVAVLQS
jgi:nucleoside-diphosphate-sugar epimerase